MDRTRFASTRWIVDLKGRAVPSSDDDSEESTPTGRRNTDRRHPFRRKP